MADDWRGNYNPGMEAVSWKVLRPGSLSPGGMRLTATSAGLTRVELWGDMPAPWTDARRFEIANGGPPNPIIDQASQELRDYFDGKSLRFGTPLNVPGDHGSFQRRIWSWLRRIPYGRPWTYGELAERAGFPGAARAVGQAVGCNPLPVFLPCHRVVGKGGQITGFSCGLSLKVRLLALEGVDVSAASSETKRRAIALPR